MTGNLTEGNIRRVLLRYTLPIFLGILFQQTYGLFDAVIVGRMVSADALASIGASDSAQFFVIGFCSGCCSGFAIPVAGFFGAQNYREMRKYIFHSYCLTAILAGIITLFCVILCADIIRILQTPGQIAADAYRYLRIIFLGIPFTMMYNLLSGILRAVGDSRTPFRFLVFSSLLNILLDVILVAVFHLGISGAAAATILSQGISGILCLTVIRKKYRFLHAQREERVFFPAVAGKLLAMGIPMGLQTSITAIGAMVLQSANNALGAVYAAAFYTGIKFENYAVTPFMALSTATATFCSQNYGAKKFGRIREGVAFCIRISLIYGVGMGSFLFFAGKYLAAFMVGRKETQVITAAAGYLKCIGVFYWVLGPLDITRMVTQGVGYPGRAMFAGVMELLARVIFSILLVPVYGFTAVCFANQAAWIAASLYIIPTALWALGKIERTIELPFSDF